MITVHMTMAPETFMQGMRLVFTIRHGSVTHTVAKQIPMLALCTQTLLDMAVDKLKAELQIAVTEHQRAAASVDPMRC